MQAYSDTPGWGILLPDGTVLFVQWNFNGLDDDIELYDPSTETFSRIGCVHGDYSYSAAVGLQDGSVLITGGQLGGGNGTPLTMRYLPWARAFVPGPYMITGRHNHAAILLLDGTVLVAGGYGVWPNRTQTAELYHPASP
jgi:hypothetical protein